jgi:hypothetical protein
MIKFFNNIKNFITIKKQNYKIKRMIKKQKSIY